MTELFIYCAVQRPDVHLGEMAVNDRLRAAREALPSLRHPGQPMARPELAVLVNEVLYPDPHSRRRSAFNANYIGKLESGLIRWPGPEYRAAMRQVLNANDEELGFYDPKAAAHVKSLASAAVAVGSSDPVRPGDRWSSFARMTHLLASQRQMIAPEALLGLVEVHRESLAVLFRDASTDRIRSQIGAMLAEASIVASRLWSAQGNRSLAVAHCAFARQLADRLDNPEVAAISRIFEANLHSDAANPLGSDGDLVLGLRLLHEAAAAGHLLSPAARARIWAEQAQAYAALRLPGESEGALAHARMAVGEISASDRTGLFSDWSPMRLQVYEGTCQLMLGHSNRAANTLESAVEAMKADSANVNVALAAEVDLATAYATDGHLEHGCQTLGNAYRRLVTIGNRRGLDRAHQARQRLNRWSGTPHVRELDAVMTSATGH